MKKIILLLSVLLFMAGCSHLSVRHLDKNPFSLNQTDHLGMRFLDFEYVSMVENGDYVVTGVALPKTDVLPGWAEWLHDFWLAVYLSDEKGKVLARDHQVFSTRRLDPVDGIPFEFRLEPEKMPVTRDIFLTFGYRMNLSESRYVRPSQDKPLTGERSVFFASEGALAR
ncbi:hypothetical protein [Desulfonatronovibrio hydrogenovorans]|uniref:hypothetical protein n=1 Tax=Desulfonatronovibrio hydrogenovorans TaxID=53245 RepID=UPI00068EA6C3|nr:hypothetical protein [Desulfonatronovibrio hydrogenovorans]